MRWVGEPPAVPLDVRVDTPERLELTGPGTAERLGGGVAAAFGGLFASFAVPFLRAPLPAPAKLIPLSFVAVGAGVAALGTSRALASCSVVAARGEGLELRWKLPGFEERVRRVAPGELAGLEVTTHEHTTESEFGRDWRTTVYRVVAVTTGGEALGLESFGTRTQAELRKAALERVLSPGPAPASPPPRRRKPR